MSSSDHDDDELDLGGVFPEAERPPSPEPTVATYARDTARVSSPDDWRELSIRLVGSHPLWGHHLWNAARCFASFLDLHSEEYCKGRHVLELGAGGGLPGIVASLVGAESVLLTDYPDAALIDNLAQNVQCNVSPSSRCPVHVSGYIWGTDVSPLLARSATGFELILLSDLIFNHSQHDALLTSCEKTLSTSSSGHEAAKPCLLVFYTHHRPRLADRDLEFFTKASSRGWECREIVTERMNAMFPDDPGDEEVRSTVHGWRLTRARAPNVE